MRQVQGKRKKRDHNGTGGAFAEGCVQEIWAGLLTIVGLENVKAAFADKRAQQRGRLGMGAGAVDPTLT